GLAEFRNNAACPPRRESAERSPRLPDKSRAAHTVRRVRIAALPASAQWESESGPPVPAVDRDGRSLRSSERPLGLRGFEYCRPSGDRLARSTCRPAVWRASAQQKRRWPRSKSTYPAAL